MWRKVAEIRGVVHDPRPIFFSLKVTALSLYYYSPVSCFLSESRTRRSNRVSMRTGPSREIGVSRIKRRKGESCRTEASTFWFSFKLHTPFVRSLFAVRTLLLPAKSSLSLSFSLVSRQKLFLEILGRIIAALLGESGEVDPLSLLNVRVAGIV